MESIYKLVKLNESGDLVISKDMVQLFGLQKGFAIEVYFEDKIFEKDDTIVVVRYTEQVCHICNSYTNDSDLLYNGKNFCKSCIDRLNALSPNISSAVMFNKP